MEGSELCAGREKIIARIRGSLLVLTLILSLMTAGLPVFAGTDQGNDSPHAAVTYETNGGSTVDPQFVLTGKRLMFQYMPKKECYVFEGWYYDTALTQPYSWSDIITRDVTLYAKWAPTTTNVSCSAAALTSTIGTVSAGETVNETITVGGGTTLAELKAAITPSANATFEIYNEDGITIVTTLETGIKIIVTPQAGTGRATTYTVAVSSENLALNKPATTDSTCTTSQNASKAVDGHTTNDSKWCSKSSNRWLQIDLGSVKQVDQFVIKHAAEGGETASYNTKAYHIQISIDGENWSKVVNVTNNTKSLTVDNIDTVSARYIKLNITTPTQTTNTAARIYEFQVFGTPNLAFNKAATADSTCNASQNAANAVDGNVANDSKWCSKSNNRWLQIDLGSVKQVNQFVIKHASEGGETQTYNTKAYQILVSTDGTNWTQVVNVTNNTSGITVDKITAVPARYVKLVVTTPTQTKNAAARIYDFEVYEAISSK